MMLSVKKCLESYPFLKEYLSSVPDSEIIDNCAIYKHKQGVKILQKNSPIEAFEIVFSGSVKLMNEFGDGINYIHKKLHAPIIVGDIEILAETPTVAASIVCSTEVYSLRVPISVYKDWMNQYPEFTKTVAKYLAIRFFESSDNIGNDIRYNTKYNLASVLVRLVENVVHERNIADDKNYEITITETRKQIADMIVVTERTVNRTLKTFKEEEFVNIKNHKITISKEQIAKIKEEILNKK